MPSGPRPGSDSLLGRRRRSPDRRGPASGSHRVKSTRMRVLPTPDGARPERVDDWMRLAVPQGEQLIMVHVTGDVEDAPRVAAVVEAVAQTGAFRQFVVSPPADELAELGV